MAKAVKQKKIYWETNEDFLADIERMKEQYVSKEELERCKNAPMPSSIKQLHEIQRKIKEHNTPEINEGNTFIISGRGKGMRDRRVEPGKPVAYSKSDDLLIKKKLREEQGLGYRNEVIEQSLGVYKEDYGHNKLLKNDSCGSSTPSSLGTTPYQSPFKTSSESSSSGNENLALLFSDNLEVTDENFPPLTTENITPNKEKTKGKSSAKPKDSYQGK